MLKWHVYSHHTCNMRRMSRILNALSILNHQSPSALYFLSASIVSIFANHQQKCHLTRNCTALGACALSSFFFCCAYAPWLDELIWANLSSRTMTDQADYTKLWWVLPTTICRPNEVVGAWSYVVIRSIRPYKKRVLELHHMGCFFLGFLRGEGHYQWSVFRVRCCCDPNSST